MDIAKIPIVDFLKYCKKGAMRKGYDWIVCILCRPADCRSLYPSIERDWPEIDSVTGPKMLVLLAGNEVKKQPQDANEFNKCCVTDINYDYKKRYTPFATFLNEKTDMETDLSPSQRYEMLREEVSNVEKSQNDAVDSLRRYLKLKEKDIPCLVYIPLHKSNLPLYNIVVPFPNGEVNLYAYFKELFGEISPMIDDLTIFENDKRARIMRALDELLIKAEGHPDYDKIKECIEKKDYYGFEEPIRGLLARYVDLCKEYTKRYGEEFSNESKYGQELLIKIEDAFSQINIPVPEKESRNVYIKIGDNNKIKNLKILVAD